MNKDYGEFLSLLREQKILGATIALLGWDEQVNLPAAASGVRAEQLSLAAKILHERKTQPRFVDLLKKLREATDLSSDERVVVRETWREIDRALKVPEALVAEISRAESETYATWVEARKKNSFDFVKAKLQSLFELKKQYAECIREGRSLYDALLDLYEPGLSGAEVKVLFSELGPELSALVRKCEDRNRGKTRQNPFRGKLAKDAQHSFHVEICRMMGFDFSRGRLDEAVHPFCTEIGFDDVRLTTRYDEDDLFPSFYAAMHEAGHGLYELGYNSDEKFTPLAEYCSMALHESQSRLWENMVGRSREFLGYLLPIIQKHFGEGSVTAESGELFRYANWAAPSLIRVEADEVSYGLHIIIRFNLEHALFSGELNFADLPAAWNESYKKYLGLTPPDELTGVLQDVHWYGGNFGYFPTYLLGSAYAAQIFSAAERAIPGLKNDIALGKLFGLREWLRKNIHAQGKRYEPKELMRRATGEEPSSRYYLEYLALKYS